MVRADQASAGYQIRSSRLAQKTVQHDQGQLCNHQEERKNMGGFRVRSQGETFRHRAAGRAPQRTPQAGWASHCAEKAAAGAIVNELARSTGGASFDDVKKPPALWSAGFLAGRGKVQRFALRFFLT